LGEADVSWIERFAGSWHFCDNCPNWHCIMKFIRIESSVSI